MRSKILFLCLATMSSLVNGMEPKLQGKGMDGAGGAYDDLSVILKGACAAKKFETLQVFLGDKGTEEIKINANELAQLVTLLSEKYQVEETEGEELGSSTQDGVKKILGDINYLIEKKQNYNKALSVIRREKRTNVALLASDKVCANSWLRGLEGQKEELLQWKREHEYYTHGGKVVGALAWAGSIGLWESIRSINGKAPFLISLGLFSGSLLVYLANPYKYYDKQCDTIVDLVTEIREGVRVPKTPGKMSMLDEVTREDIGGQGSRQASRVLFDTRGTPTKPTAPSESTRQSAPPEYEQ